jgi:hypothetical protein
VRADVDVPLRKFKMTLLLKRNLDKSLPASHVVELTFHLPPDFAGGGIGNVPGILMKSNELARGTAPAGLSVKVADGFLWSGCRTRLPTASAICKHWSAHDSTFPLSMSTSDAPSPANAAIEKSETSEQAFKAAFTAWGQYPLTVQPLTGRHCAGRCTDHA